MAFDWMNKWMTNVMKWINYNERRVMYKKVFLVHSPSNFVFNLTWILKFLKQSIILFFNNIIQKFITPTTYNLHSWKGDVNKLWWWCCSYKDKKFTIYLYLWSYKFATYSSFYFITFRSNFCFCMACGVKIFIFSFNWNVFLLV